MKDFTCKCLQPSYSFPLWTCKKPNPLPLLEILVTILAVQKSLPYQLVKIIYMINSWIKDFETYPMWYKQVPNNICLFFFRVGGMVIIILNLIHIIENRKILALTVTNLSRLNSCAKREGMRQLGHLHTTKHMKVKT